jgi:hypothetical protein
MSLPAAKKMWRKLVLLSCCLLVASGGNTYVLRGNFTVPTPIVVSFLYRDSGMRFYLSGFRPFLIDIHT